MSGLFDGPKERPKGQNSRELAHTIGEDIMSGEVFATLNGSEEILVYKLGIYRRGGEFVIKADVQKIALPEDLGNSLVSEVIGNVQRSTYVQVERFTEPTPNIVVENGLLNVETFALGPHTPDHYSLSGLPVKFDLNGTCPAFERFLPEVLYRDDIPIVQEWFGYCLHRGYPAQLAILFVGDGSNGKSTLIGVLKALLGFENISSVSLQELELNRFAKADLFGKLANLYADLPDSALKSIGTFKMLTGGDPIRGEKKFQDSFPFVNNAKLTFSCNVVPEVYEDTAAFFRRWIIIQFPHIFEGEKADKDLLKKLTTPEELSGILNWALLGLKRLRENGWTFSNSRPTEELRLDYIRRSSPMKAFTMDVLTINTRGRVPKKSLYQAFAKYCEKNKLPLVTEATFFRNLPMYFASNPLQESREEIGGNRVRCFLGIEIRPEEEWGKPKSDSDESREGEDHGHGGQDGQDRLDSGHEVHDVQGPPDHSLEDSDGK